MARSNYSSRTAILTGGVTIAALIGMAACSPTPTAMDEQEANIKIEDVAEDTEALIGNKVTLRGEFLLEVSKSSFKLREDTLLPDEAVLVVNATGNEYSVPLGEATPMWVTGVVETFDRETIAEQYDLQLEADLYDEYMGQPVVIADYIALAPSPDEIVDNPDAFYGQRVVVDGEVSTIFAPDAFSLENEQFFEENSLLVVGAVPDVAAEGPIAVSGVLQLFSLASLDADYDLLWERDIQTMLEADHAGKPAIVAEEIYPFTE